MRGNNQHGRRVESSVRDTVVSGVVGLGAAAIVFVVAAGVVVFEFGRSTDASGLTALPVLFLGDVFWLFTAAHLGASSPPFVLFEPGVLRRVPPTLVVLVPSGTLLAAGGIQHRLRAANAPRESAQAAATRGTSVAFGYLVGTLVPLAVLYAQRPFPLAPSLRPVVVAGVVYPVVFGGLGGFVGHTLHSRQSESTGSARGRAASEADGSTRKFHGGRHDSGGKRRESHGRRHAERDSRVETGESAETTSVGRVHYQETLEPRGTTVALLFVGVGFFLPTVAASVLVPTETLADLLLVGVSNVVVFGLLAGVYRISTQEVVVTVGTEGVEIEQEPPPIFGDGYTFVPFEAVESVRYRGCDGNQIRVTREDRERAATAARAADGLITFTTEFTPERYLVSRAGRSASSGGYEGGIRIGRERSPPVYVASEYPRRLAETIADRSPAVSAVGTL